MTNDGQNADLQVWDLGGDDSGEIDFTPACDVTQGLTPE